MAKVFYPAVLERGASGGFGVFFPDLDGCVSAGATASEAAKNAEEALALHLEGMAEDGQELPPATELDAIAPDPEVQEVARLLIGVEEPKVGERFNVFMPKSLVARIDRYVAEQGMGGSRSGFLVAACKRMLEEPRLVASPATVQVYQLPHSGWCYKAFDSSGRPMLGARGYQTKEAAVAAAKQLVTDDRVIVVPTEFGAGEVVETGHALGR
jgi:predicted RNase H-like HicB family nuclease